jgi:hypothetical protein
VIGGFSEPPTALMITILGLGVLATWRWGNAQNRWRVVTLFVWSLVGAVTALLVMGLAPANSLRMQSPPPPLLELVIKIMYYPSFFVTGTLRTLPLPTLMSIIVPATFFYVKYVYPYRTLSRERRNRLGILMILVLLFTYLLIAATFAPSIYGQSYPVPRARFAARVLMTAALMTDGALIGILAAQVSVKTLPSVVIRKGAILMLAILALYPLRTAWRTFGDIAEYRQRAAVWDAREAEIRAMKAQGQKDLAIRFLAEVPIQDLGDHKGYRLNRCAAALYGVNTIVAVPMGDP